MSIPPSSGRIAADTLLREAGAALDTSHPHVTTMAAGTAALRRDFGTPKRHDWLLLGLTPGELVP